MSAYLATFYEGVRAAIAATWPETVANNIYRDTEMANTSLNKKAQNQQLPFAVFKTDLSQPADFGDDAQIAQGRLWVYYVAADDVSRDALTAKLEALRDGLYAADPAGGQLIEYPKVLDTVSMPMLQQFFTMVQRPFVAGGVSCGVISGGS